MSWDDVVQSMALEWDAWGPHSLHTAEVTGSIPVTPTSTNGFLEPSGAPLASSSLLAAVTALAVWEGLHPESCTSTC